MAINILYKDRLASIAMSGRFDFGVHQDFKKAYTAALANASVREIEIEMSKLDYMDCAALGMLMLLNERAKDAKKSVSLVNVSGVALHVLEVANFDHFFKIKKLS